MGRKKIVIQQITDPKLRNITYNKRKNGLIKKAAEISLLCNIKLLLVFEDLNGTLVQFSTNKIKSIADFTKQSNYKRKVELAAEDYPDFSRIKRHKKKHDTPEQTSSDVPSVCAKKNARTLEEMSSDYDSIVAKEENISTDHECVGNFFSTFNLYSGVPEIKFSDQGLLSFSHTPKFELHQDAPRKAVKTTIITQPTEANKPMNQREAKRKPELHLNTQRVEDTIREAAKFDSRGSRKKDMSSGKQNSSGQKMYSRKFNFETNNPKSFENKAFKNFEEDLTANITDFSPFNYQFIVTTPPILKQKEGDDGFATEKIVNYLSQSGRTPPTNTHQIFTFQPTDFQNMMFDSMYGTDGDAGLVMKNNYWEQQLSGNNVYGKTTTNTFEGRRQNFDEYFFGNEQRMMDHGETFGTTKMV